MAYTVKIRQNATGEVRDRLMNLDWRDDDKSIWWWTEGNFGCDCNREWEFQRAGGEEISENPVCGNTRYTVIEAVFEDGRVVPIDNHVRHSLKIEITEA